MYMFKSSKYPAQHSAMHSEMEMRSGVWETERLRNNAASINCGNQHQSGIPVSAICITVIVVTANYHLICETNGYRE